jgi:hypothetical protein
MRGEEEELRGAPVLAEDALWPAFCPAAPANRRRSVSSLVLMQSPRKKYYGKIKFV